MARQVNTFRNEKDGSINKEIIVLVGPTAVGKTTLAIELAKHFQTEIISADSRQCFKELNIGVARPSPEQLSEIRHHFIASHHITEEVNAATFEEFALKTARSLFEKHDRVIMVGGTGLYIKAFCEGLDKIPSVDPLIRNKIINDYGEKGLSWLQDEMQRKDPAYFKAGEIQNPQRMMRALEVMEATGKSILDFREKQKANREFHILKIGLDLPRKDLNLRIETRVDKMFEAGLIEEVRQLIPYKNLNALQTVGYQEVFKWLDEGGKREDLDKLKEEIIINTRQYAKRQVTWFKKDKEIRWIEPNENVIEMLY